jgi:hypothetical protein
LTTWTTSSKSAHPQRDYRFRLIFMKSQSSPFIETRIRCVCVCVCVCVSGLREQIKMWRTNVTAAITTDMQISVELGWNVLTCHCLWSTVPSVGSPTISAKQPVLNVHAQVCLVLLIFNSSYIILASTILIAKEIRQKRKKKKKCYKFNFGVS